MAAAEGGSSAAAFGKANDLSRDSKRVLLDLGIAETFEFANRAGGNSNGDSAAYREVRRFRQLAAAYRAFIVEGA
jgi:hypothetical protein